MKIFKWLFGKETDDNKDNESNNTSESSNVSERDNTSENLEITKVEIEPEAI